MLNQYRAALQSWVVVGLVLALVLGAQAYRAGHDGPAAESAHLLALLGRSQKTVDAGSFHGGEVTAVMAGAELDLRSATLAPGDEMIIDVLAVMGGVVIRVPDGWTVDTRAVPVAGGIRDRRLRPFESLDAPLTNAASPPAPRLVLRGAVVMGGLIIKS